MRQEKREPTHESQQSLWLLAASPSIWAVHFLLCYITGAVWIAKRLGRDASLASVRLTVAIITVVALFGIGLTLWRGLRRQRYEAGTIPHDFDSPESRHRFIGFATVLLSGLSAVATVFTALVVVFMERSH